MNDLEKYMPAAINEARISFKKGNHGFGAVIIKDGKIIAKAHDCDESDADATSHAEINAIKLASKKIGKNLKDCILLATHEPCPMCAAAILWSGITHIGYGYSIKEAIKQGRNRINMPCDELFHRAGKKIKVEKNILFSQCRVLYLENVRNEIKRLRNVTLKKLKQYNEESKNRRITWIKNNRATFRFMSDNLLFSAYNVLLARLQIDSSGAKVIDQSENHIVFHSTNFCPTLEACKILEYDTRYICKHYNENSTDMMIKQIDTRLSFKRNYDKIRPYADYCEEMIFWGKP